MSKRLTRIEKKTFEFIKEAGRVQPKNMPNRKMIGAISTLKRKGLVKIYKDYTSRYQRKKKKFVKVKNA